MNLRADPVEFARAFWKVELWPRLRELAHLITQHDRVVVVGANAVGKSWTIALCALHYLATHRNSIVLITSASWGQLQRGLWRYIQGLARECPALGFRVLQNRVEKSPDWRAEVVASNAPERFQGVHAGRLMVVVDEGSGVPEWLREVVISLSPHKVVVSGNPLEPEGVLWDIWNDGHYIRMNISALDHPNIREGRIVFPGGPTPAMIVEFRDRYGEDHPVYVARVLGQFPEDADTMLIPWGLIREAVNRIPADDTGAVIGVDVARGGGDLNAAAILRGDSLWKVETWDSRNLMETTGRIVNLFRESSDTQLIVVDETGLGGGVVDRLREMGYPVMGVNFGAAPVDKGRYANARAEMWWTLREALRDWLCIPDDRVLHDDLVAPRFTYDSRGRIKLEAKEDVRAMIGRSPDRGDALALAVWGRKMSTLTGQDEPILWDSPQVW